MTCSDCKDGRAIFLACPLRYPDIHCPYTETRCSTCYKVAIIQKRIDAKIEEIETLARELRDVREEVNQTHSRIMQTLPTEVMSEIFSLYVNSDHKDGYRPDNGRSLSETRRNRRELKLGKISKVLRNIAWNTPSIWTNVEINVEYDYPSKHLDLLHAFVSRSASLPLNIQLYWSSWDPSSCNKSYQAAVELHMDQPYDKDHISGQFSDLVDVVAQSSHRWFRLVTDMHMDLVSYLFKVAQDVSNLKEMEFQDARGLRSRPNDFQMFGNAIPSPQSVNIQGELVFRHFNIDWTRVTFLKIGSLTSQSFLVILQACPLLESLTVSYFGSDHPLPTSPGPPSSPLHITHSGLRFLAIPFGFDYEVKATPLSKVTFPRLCELVIRFGGYAMNTGHIDVLIEFCRRSSSNTLQKMKLEFGHVRNGTQIDTELIHACPSLVQLQLLVNGNTATLPINFYKHPVQSSTVHDPSISPTPLLPLLEVMEVTIPMPSIVTLNTFLDIFDPARAGSEGTIDHNQSPRRHSLRILKLCTSPLREKGTPDIIRRLSGFKEAGIDVEWVSSEGVKIYPDEYEDFMDHE